VKRAAPPPPPPAVRKRRVRFWPALILGTILNVGITFLIIGTNGTSMPSVFQPKLLLAYPTGNVVTYFLVIWIIYTLAVWITAKRR
jgi:hypothetical protein